MKTAAVIKGMRKKERDDMKKYRFFVLALTTLIFALVLAGCADPKGLAKQTTELQKKRLELEKKAADVGKKAAELSPINRLIYDAELARLGGKVPEGLADSGLGGILNFFGGFLSRAPKEKTAVSNNDDSDTGGKSGNFLANIFASILSLSDEDGEVDDTEQAAPAGEIAKSSSEIGGSSGGGSSGDGKADPFFNTFNSGTYHMKAKTTVEGMEVISDSYVKDGMVATVGEMAGISTRTIIRDNKVYAIMDSLKMVYVAPLESGDQSGKPPVQTAGMVKTSSGTARFNGKNMHYEEYSDEKGNKVQIFLDGNELAGTRTIINGNIFSEMVVLALDQNIPANIFNIPRGYTLIER